MHFHLVAEASYNWSFMTRSAGISIEQRTETIFRFKDTLKYSFPVLELGPLLRCQVGKRFAQGWRLRRLASTKTNTHEQQPCNLIRFHRFARFSSFPRID